MFTTKDTDSRIQVNKNVVMLTTRNTDSRIQEWVCFKQEIQTPINSNIVKFSIIILAEKSKPGSRNTVMFTTRNINCLK